MNLVFLCNSGNPRYLNISSVFGKSVSTKLHAGGGSLSLTAGTQKLLTLMNWYDKGMHLSQCVGTGAFRESVFSEYARPRPRSWVVSPQWRRVAYPEPLPVTAVWRAGRGRPQKNRPHWPVTVCPPLTPPLSPVHSPCLSVVLSVYARNLLYLSSLFFHFFFEHMIRAG